MPVIFSDAIIQIAIGFAILAVMIMIAAYVLGMLHPKSLQQEPTAGEHLDNFRELELKGKLSAEEFRKIKKQLASRIVEQWDGKSDEPEATVLLARQGAKSFAEPENSEDTQIVGKNKEGNADDTVADR